MRDKLEIYLKLALTPGVGPVRVRALIEHFGSPESIFESSASKLESVPGVGKKVARAILGDELESQVQKEIETARAGGVTIVCPASDGWPRGLKNLPDSPVVLYVRGDISLLDSPQVAVVGSRSNTYYGRSMAMKISSELSRFGITITSGMARGIDSAAHQGVLSCGGKTIAVLGSGVDVVYPPENSKLYEGIAESGAVVSEFPMGTIPDAGNFPRRNRIISGLSEGVFVVEAGLRSGALITAGYALEQGKPVFALPGAVSSIQSRGPHSLIKDGAYLVEEAMDIVRVIAPNLMREIKESEARPNSLAANLSEDEKILLSLLDETPRHIDFFIAKTAMAPGAISGVMLGLQMKGLVRQMPGSAYARSL